MDLEKTEKKVAIVGAGASGVLCAVHLLKASTKPIHLTFIEKSPVTGLGVAYSTSDECHLLNVPAGKMSLFEDEPGDFLDWLILEGGGKSLGLLLDRENLAGRFLPRKIYGLYLQARLEKFIRKAKEEGCSVEWIHASAERIDYREELFLVALDNGKSLAFHDVILATGHLQPQTPSGISETILKDPQYFENPWDIQRIKKIDPHVPVLIVGTGLTMVDCVLSFKSSGHRGKIYSISRKGLLPRPHGASPVPYRLPSERPLPRELRPLTRFIRSEIAHLEKKGGSWHGVIDSLRSRTSFIWQGFSVEDQKRFLRHLKSYWEVHRHRVPVESHQTLAKMQEKGELLIYSGRIQEVRPISRGFEVQVLPKGESQSIRFEVGAIINATGPIHDFRKTDVPLVRSLMEQGLMRPDRLGFGMDVDETSHLVGAPQGIYALGSLTKGRFWEITAVPDIRVQARGVAARVLER